MASLVVEVGVEDMVVVDEAPSFTHTFICLESVHGPIAALRAQP
jgi:hypothetical protein